MLSTGTFSPHLATSQYIWKVELTVLNVSSDIVRSLRSRCSRPGAFHSIRHSNIRTSNFGLRAASIRGAPLCRSPTTAPSSRLPRPTPKAEAPRPMSGSALGSWKCSTMRFLASQFKFPRQSMAHVSQCKVVVQFISN